MSHTNAPLPIYALEDNPHVAFARFFAAASDSGNLNRRLYRKVYFSTGVIKAFEIHEVKWN